MNVLRNIYKWSLINLMVMFINIMTSLMMMVLVDQLKLEDYRTLYISVFVHAVILAFAFLFEHKIPLKWYLAFLISIIAGLGNSLYILIFQPKMCSGDFFIVPNRVLMILIVISLIGFSLLFAYRKSKSWLLILVGIFAFIHFMCAYDIIPFNYLSFVNHQIWKIFS